VLDSSHYTLYVLSIWSVQRNIFRAEYFISNQGEHMKLTIRTFVAVLALTGAVASAHTYTSSNNNTRIVASKASAFPIPMCPPDDPNACGMGQPSPK
jgi:hypothetical protein